MISALAWSLAGRAAGLAACLAIAAASLAGPTHASAQRTVPATHLRFDRVLLLEDSGYTSANVGFGDVSGDGLQDIVFANRYGPRNGPEYICFGVGDGRFEDPCTEFATTSATTITAADFDGDGDLDLAVPHRDGGQSYVYLNDSSGHFEKRVAFGPPDAAIRTAAAADLDGDGALDLAVIDERTGPATYHGRRDGSFDRPVPLGPSGPRPYAIKVADLDRDGRPDVIVGYMEARPVVFFNEGGGTFTSVPFGDDQGEAYGFAVGDVDEDGFLDIGMARSDAPNVLYFGGPPGGG